MEVKLGQRTLSPPSPTETRFNALLWGDSGVGKTTLAATAPGIKLWVLFDNSGDASLVGRDDVLVLNLSGETHSVVERFKDDDPFGVARMLKDNPQIETIVLDSATAVAQLGTENAVSHVKSATLENPGLKGFGHRNAITLRVIVSLMRVAQRMGKHFIVIAHEDTPDKREDGTINFITTAIGGKMTNQVGMQLNEIWWMSQTEKGERRIAVKPVRLRKPMKSRMFDLTGPVGEFTWSYNPNTWSGDGIETWFKKWQEGGGRKLPIPGSPK